LWILLYNVVTNIVVQRRLQKSMYNVFAFFARRVQRRPPQRCTTMFILTRCTTSSTFSISRKSHRCTTMFVTTLYNGVCNDAVQRCL
jgi:hypothetical protein